MHYVYAGFLRWSLSIGTSTSQGAPGPLVDWLGDWEGELVVLQGADTVQRTHMSLSIHALDNGRYAWAIGYGESDSDERAYVLVPNDRTGMTFRLDERTGIILDVSLLGEVIYNRFEVGGDLWLTRDELRGDALHHEVVTGSTVAALTGDVVSASGNPVPAVGADHPARRQVARLSRQCHRRIVRALVWTRLPSVSRTTYEPGARAERSSWWRPSVVSGQRAARRPRLSSALT